MDSDETRPIMVDNKPSNDISISTPIVNSTKSPFIDFVTENDGRDETILLIHGAGASGSDWSLVVPYLSSHHLLIPSLFTSTSLDIVRSSRHASGPDQVASSVLRRWDSCYILHLAELVKTHAKHGRAHIVGLSFGGCLAVKMVAAYPELCLSLFVSGLPIMISPPLYSIVKPIGTGLMWTQHAIAKAVGADNVGKFLEGEVDTDPGAWDGKGGGSTIEMNGILTETVIYKGKGEYYVERMRRQAQSGKEGTEKTTFRVRLVAASRKSKWTPVADSPVWATEAGKIMIGERKGPTDPVKGELVEDVDCRVYEAKRMFHPWSRQDPELFAQCILATVVGTEFLTQGLQEVWTNSSPSVTDR